MKKSLKNTVLLALAMSLSFCSKNDDDNTGNDPIIPVQNPALMKELTASPEGSPISVLRLPLPPAATALKKRGEA